MVGNHWLSICFPFFSWLHSIHQHCQAVEAVANPRTPRIPLMEVPRTSMGPEVAVGEGSVSILDRKVA